jgi:murein DD-endopeptidase MepM/ murein hydrolase activator NlpD
MLKANLNIAFLGIFFFAACKARNSLDIDQQSSLAGIVSYSGVGKIFLTAIHPSETWIKENVNGELIKRCAIMPGTIIELSKAAVRDYKTNHIFISMKSKTFSRPGNNSDPASYRREAPSSDSKPKEPNPNVRSLPAFVCDNYDEGSLDKALCNISPYQDKLSQGFELTGKEKSSGLESADDEFSLNGGSDEPRVCNLTEGYIWPEHWKGAVIERKKLVFPAGYLPIRACYTASPGETQLGYSRGGGSRAHAGCDIHAPRGSNSPFLAMQDGMVVDSYPLDNNGLYGCATEVVFPSFFVRYGEHSCTDVRKSGPVASGELIGRTGRLGARSDVDMLHIEFYRDTEIGPLTILSSPPFMRRKDLFDPTKMLRELSMESQSGD